MIRLGVIGIGRMGGKHAKNIAKGSIKGGILTAVCDIDKDKTDKFISKYPDVKAYSDYKLMLADSVIDAVIIATEHYYHTDIAIDCLNSGLHILVEKPIAVAVSEGERLNKVADKYPNQKYAIMYNQRTNRMYRRAKEIIESGTLGELRRINFIITDWYRSQAYFDQGGWRASWSGEGGGALINQCVHQLDILQWLCGMPISINARCNTRNRRITVENEVVAVMEYPNKMIATFTAATNELNGTNRLEIAGDKGRIVVERLKMRHLIFNKSEEEVNRDTTKGYGYTLFKVRRTYYGLRNILNDITRGQQANIIKNFVKSISGKEELIADGREGVKALSLINGIYLSDSLSETVNLPLDNSAYDKLLMKKIELEKTIIER